MSNLIQYIIQDDPEQEMKKKQSQSLLSREGSSQEETGKNYKFSSRHLLENDFSYLNSKQAPTARSYLSQTLTNSMAKEGNKVSSALLPKPIGNDALSFKIAQNTKGNVANDAKVNNIDYSLYGEGFDKKDIDEMLNDKRFNNIMNSRVKINEGGYVNHPNDRGGETKFAISSRWYPTEDIKNLTQERASMLLFRDYWKKTNIYQLPDELADIVLDDSIVQGQPTAIKNLQKALGIIEDGIIGANTLRAIKNTNYKILKEKFIENVKKVEEQYLNNDPSQRVFEKGHKNRFNKY